MKQIEFINTNIYGAVTLKDKNAPEHNNMALHVCIDPEQVMKNRQALSQETKVSLENWALPWQKHTDRCIEITQNDKGKGAFDKNTSIMDVDAVYTSEPGILIGVFTADCVGILLCDETRPCVCAIHSGWKGTAQAITYHTVHQLLMENKLDPEHTRAFFSPSILMDSLEVGMEVVDQIEQMGKDLRIDTRPFIRHTGSEKAYIDNQGLNIAMLEMLGIHNIKASTLDTKKETDLCFSYRNDKQCGEHFTYGYIKKEQNDH